eukprot:7077093-Pyramimonas_sp.AAC.1
MHHAFCVLSTAAPWASLGTCCVGRAPSRRCHLGCELTRVTPPGSWTSWCVCARRGLLPKASLCKNFGFGTACTRGYVSSRPRSEAPQFPPSFSLPNSSFARPA